MTVQSRYPLVQSGSAVLKVWPPGQQHWNQGVSSGLVKNANFQPHPDLHTQCLRVEPSLWSESDALSSLNTTGLKEANISDLQTKAVPQGRGAGGAPHS